MQSHAHGESQATLRTRPQYNLSLAQSNLSFLQNNIPLPQGNLPIQQSNLLLAQSKSSSPAKPSSFRTKQILISHKAIFLPKRSVPLPRSSLPLPQSNLPLPFLAPARRFFKATPPFFNPVSLLVVRIGHASSDKFHFIRLQTLVVPGTRALAPTAASFPPL
eukprot:4879123-Pleurochrysis_carterae.AAC.1